MGEPPIWEGDPEMHAKAEAERAKARPLLNGGKHPDGRDTSARSGDAVWPEPDLRILDDECASPPEFDWDGVPPAWHDWIKGAAKDAGAPVDYVTGGLYATASGALGNAARVRPWGTWIEHPHLWICLVGHPSSNKTPAVDPIKAACRAIEKEAMPNFDIALLDYETRKESARVEHETWKKEVRDAEAAQKAPPQRPASSMEPERPAAPRLLIVDSSTEEAVNILAGAPKGLIMIRNELSGWIGQFDRYGGAGTDRAFYIESYDGSFHRNDRVKHNGKPVEVPFDSLAIIGGVQPDKLRELFSGPDDGLAARFIYIWPEPLEPVKPPDNDHYRRAAFLLRALRRLRALEMDRDGTGDPTPHVLPLDGDAETTLQSVRVEVAAENRKDRGVMSGWRGKNPGRLLRLANTFEHLEWAAGPDGIEPPTIISDRMMRRAADYLDYCTAMMHRSLGEMAMTQAQRGAAQLARMIQTERPRLVNERQIYQRPGFSSLRDNDHRKRVFAELEEAGWLRCVAGRQGGARGRWRSDWEVNPKFNEAT